MERYEHLGCFKRYAFSTYDTLSENRLTCDTTALQHTFIATTALLSNARSSEFTAAVPSDSQSHLVILLLICFS